MNVSVLLLTFNEASNLPRCLDALAWCDDIAIVDCGSSDGTLDIAQARNVRVLHRSFDDFASQRNFGLVQAGFTHDWVLHLDADEVVTPAFVARLFALEPEDGIDAYHIPSKLIIFNQWLRHAGMFPVYQVRLGRVERLIFRQVGHGQQEDLPPDRIGLLDEPYLHYAFSNGLKRWLERHVDYAAAEAKELIRMRQVGQFRPDNLLSRDRVTRRRAAKALVSWTPLFLRPLFRFVYIYVIRCGFLDGRVGFLYAFMLSTYEAMTAILAYEKNKEKSDPNATRRI
jgi:glycosyltransferase involved in cell wall biosynthesis